MIRLQSETRRVEVGQEMGADTNRLVKALSNLVEIEGLHRILGTAIGV